jgi:phage terminase large subunit-like protein
MVDLARAKALAEEIDRRDRRNLAAHLFPATTHTWRGRVYHEQSAYPKQRAFFAATDRYREVALMASNRSGKTVAGGYALYVWLTGRYPVWWRGKRFPGPTDAWAAGKTNETARDIIQATLFGNVTADDDGRKSLSGTGIIPGDLIGKISWRSGIADTVDVVHIRHTSGGWSTLGLKSYQQGRTSFEGTAKHAIWLDEEPPLDVAMECLTRTATLGGVQIYTFTPLLGMSEVAMRFVPGQAVNQDATGDSRG